MLFTSSNRIGYVLKMYPRFSETFILNEILAHEAAGMKLEIFSLRPPNDGRFHEMLAKVRAPVTYLPSNRPKVADFWQLIGQAKREFPDLWPVLDQALEEDTRDVYQALLLAREARARKIKHFHAHFGSVSTTVARLAGHFANIPYSFTAHAKDIFHESVQPEDLRRKLNDATDVVTVSQYNLTYLQQHYDLAAKRVRCVYNGLDLAEFPYQLPHDRPARIVAVGRLVEKKGFIYLIEACKLLVEQGRQFQAEIVGKGLLKAELQARIEQLGLEDYVQLIGPRPQGEVKKYVQQAAVFAAPCVIGQDGNRDGLPTVLLEAMALGTPCIATDVTGIPEILRHGITGLSIPQNDPAALAEALAKLLDDSQLRVQLAGNARRLIEAEFDIRRNAARVREYFGVTRWSDAEEISQPEMEVV